MKNLMIWMLILISLMLFSCGESKLDRDEREACENKPGTWHVSSEFFRKDTLLIPMGYKIFLNESILDEGMIAPGTNNVRFIPAGTTVALGDRLKIEIITPDVKGKLILHVVHYYWNYSLHSGSCIEWNAGDWKTPEISGPYMLEYTMVDLR